MKRKYAKIKFKFYKMLPINYKIRFEGNSPLFSNFYLEVNANNINCEEVSIDSDILLNDLKKLGGNIFTSCFLNKDKFDSFDKNIIYHCISNYLEFEKELIKFVDKYGLPQCGKSFIYNINNLKSDKMIYIPLYGIVSLSLLIYGMEVLRVNSNSYKTKNVKEIKNLINVFKYESPDYDKNIEIIESFIRVMYKKIRGKDSLEYNSSISEVNKLTKVEYKSTFKISTDILCLNLLEKAWNLYLTTITTNYRQIPTCIYCGDYLIDDTIDEFMNIHTNCLNDFREVLLAELDKKINNPKCKNIDRYKTKKQEYIKYDSDVYNTCRNRLYNRRYDLNKRKRTK